MALIEAFGFALDRQRGSPRVYVRDDVREIVNVQPRSDRKAKTAQGESFLDLVRRRGLDLEEETP